MVVAVLTIGLLPTASAQEWRKGLVRHRSAGQHHLIAGTVGNEYETAVALAEKYMAEVRPNVTVKVVERPTSTTETIAQYQRGSSRARAAKLMFTRLTCSTRPCSRSTW